VTATRWNARRQPSTPKGAVDPMFVAKKPPIMPPGAHQGDPSQRKACVFSTWQLFLGKDRRFKNDASENSRNCTGSVSHLGLGFRV
jgi:hypothetical protein